MRLQNKNYPDLQKKINDEKQGHFLKKESSLDYQEFRLKKKLFFKQKRKSKLALYLPKLAA